METSEQTRPTGPGPGTGFMLGLFGYLVALVCFGWEGLFTGMADAHDQLAAGLSVAILVGVVATVAVVVAVLRMWRHRPRAAYGLLGGMVLGVILVALLTIRIAGVMAEAPGTCPCEPLIDQIRYRGGG